MYGRQDIFQSSHRVQFPRAGWLQSRTSLMRNTTTMIRQQVHNWMQKLSPSLNDDVQFMGSLGVCQDSTEEDRGERIGRMDVDKGSSGVTEVRSRLVARGFKTMGGHELEVCAAMPPLEAKRALFHMARMEGSVGGDDPHAQVMLVLVDVKRAQLNGKRAPDELAFVRLPPVVGEGCTACAWQRRIGRTTMPRT